MSSLWKKQKLLLLACTGTAVVSGTLVSLFLLPKERVREIQGSPQKGSIKTPGATVNSNEIWMQGLSEETQLQSKKLDVLEQIVHKQIVKDKVDPQKFAQLQKELEAIKERLGERTRANRPSEQTPEKGMRSHVHSGGFSPMVKHVVHLKGNRFKVGMRIPPGSYAKAVLLSAVDASVGVNVASDPQPVVMRLLGDGKLPNNAMSHMKRCHIVGSATGDLSSERVFIRLGTLSCVNTRTQQISETNIKGYVTGEDGKN